MCLSLGMNDFKKSKNAHMGNSTGRIRSVMYSIYRRSVGRSVVSDIKRKPNLCGCRHPLL